MTKEKFKTYVRVQESGLTNMWDIIRVVELSDNQLTKEDYLDIITHYGEYEEKYENK